MRQPPEDRALYYRQLRQTLRTTLVPELTSAQAVDAAALIDRILAEFVVEEEHADELSAEFGSRFAALLGADVATVPVTPARFDELRAAAASAPDQRAADVERAFLERVDELRRAELEPVEGDRESPERCSMTAGELTDRFRKWLPDSPGVAVERVTLIPGGRSKETMLVALRGTTEIPCDVVIRKDRPVGLLPTRASDEFELLRVLHDHGVPVPRPLFVDADGDTTLEVMERVRGTKAGEYFPDLAAPTEHRAEIGRQLAVALAKLHSVPLDRLAGTTLDPANAVVTEASVLGMVNAIVGRIDKLSGPPNATVPLARAWLVEHVSDVVPASRLAVLQSDFGLHNTLVDGAEVTALVDWEGAAIGPPARELAAAWNTATALTTWPEFLAAYVDAGGHPEDADPRAISYYRVVLSLGGLMTSRAGGHLFRTGAKRDLLTAHSGLDSQFRCARNLARALSDAQPSAPRSR